MPKIRLFIHRDAPQLPASPIANPSIPNLAARLPVRRMIGHLANSGITL
jgi:hypothetical protein